MWEREFMLQEHFPFPLEEEKEYVQEFARDACRSYKNYLHQNVSHNPVMPLKS